ncbi:MAG: CDP-diacylglycerol--glycerol-3-phosphate 3-phosphatidyltransferase [Alphaproteobacteria bacterium]|nr:CDP-diacylglycerol--glycerol-3-phosphate 3-phosphatidyltransferase [Alphaproteobacteria bacterium]
MSLWPNILTLARITAIPLIVGLMFAGEDGLRWLAVALFAGAAITDFLDGYLARRFKVISPFGRMLDPIADKLLVGAILVALAFEGTLGLAGVIAALLILSREIFISGLREFLSEHRIAVPVTALAKYKTVVQLAAIGTTMAWPLLPELQLPALGLLWLAAALTLITGYQYFASAWPHITTRQSPK